MFSLPRVALARNWLGAASTGGSHCFRSEGTSPESRYRLGHVCSVGAVEEWQPFLTQLGCSCITLTSAPSSRGLLPCMHSYSRPL